MIITCLPILWTTLVMASAQTYSSEQSSLEESGTVFQNKNVNVIVNVNAQELAQELWKIIEARLNNRSHITSSKSILRNLEQAIIPLISSSRRGTYPPVFQVASQLDRITRRALTRDTPDMNMLDEEIMTRDIVADMMASLKMIFSKENQMEIDKKGIHNRRMISHHAGTTILNDHGQDDYVNVRIKIRRKDILDALN